MWTDSFLRKIQGESEEGGKCAGQAEIAAVLARGGLPEKTLERRVKKAIEAGQGGAFLSQSPCPVLGSLGLLALPSPFQVQPPQSGMCRTF